MEKITFMSACPKDFVDGVQKNAQFSYIHFAIDWTSCQDALLRMC